MKSPHGPSRKGDADARSRAAETHADGGRALPTAGNSSTASQPDEVGPPRTNRLPVGLRLIRATAILPIAIMGVGAVVSYGIALLELVGIVVAVMSGLQDLPSRIVELVRLVDLSLVGMLMSILAFGIYELFLGTFEWPLAPALVVRDIWDLERRVAQTVAVILAVTALDVVVEPVHQESELAVVGAAAIALLAIGVYLRLESGRHVGPR